MARLLVVGSMNMDYVVTVDRYPVLGETVHGGDLQMFFGGKGANQAVAAARCGANVALFGCVGGDPAGEMVIKNLAGYGIQTAWVRQTQNATGTALIIVDKRGNNAIVVSPGANNTIQASRLTDPELGLNAFQVALLQLEIPLDEVFQAIRILKKAGVTVVLNPSPAYKLPQEILALVDHLILNESELEFFTETADLEKSLQKIAGWGVNNIVLTLGEQGALLYRNGNSQIFPSYAVQVVDTTGAGDTFTGSYATLLAEGHSLETCVQFANAAAALSITQMGAQSAIPMREEVLEFVRKKGGAIPAL